MKEFVLAYDLGTTSCKVTLHDGEGAVVAAASSAYPTYHPASGYVEQRPADWWNAACAATRTVLDRANLRSEKLGCLVWTGQTMGCVPVDRRAKPLRDAIIWADGRAVEQAERIDDALGPEEIYRITGHRMEPYYSLPKFMWVREREAKVFEQTHRFLSAKDWLIALATGRFVTDPSSASVTNAFDITRREWSAPVLNAAGLDLELMPEVVESTAVVGGTSKGAAVELGVPHGLPVVAGGGDNACATLGVGAYTPGRCYLYLGSSGWIAASSSRPQYDHYRRTAVLCHVVPGMYFESGATQSAAAVLEWSRDILYPSQGSNEPDGRLRYEETEREILAAEPGGAGVLFLPYLMGERCPWWDQKARGAFLGLRADTTRDQMMRATVEGICMNLRIILQIFRQRGISVEALPVIGGGAKSDAWLRILTDVLDTPIERIELVQEAPSIGAAILGGTATGIYPDFSVVDGFRRVAARLEPEDDHRARYEVLFRQFTHAYECLRSVNTEIAYAGTQRS